MSKNAMEREGGFPRKTPSVNSWDRGVPGERSPATMTPQPQKKTHKESTPATGPSRTSDAAESLDPIHRLKTD